jgi:hypothetical protein
MMEKFITTKEKCLLIKRTQPDVAKIFFNCVVSQGRRRTIKTNKHDLSGRNKKHS